MRLRILNIADVAAAQLCCGCGACAYMDPEHVRMADVLDHGRRPIVTPGGNGHTAEALRVCPGMGLEHTFDAGNPALIHSLTPGWGPVFALWEGHAADEEIRFNGSSGGAATALALYCLGALKMHGVVHVAGRRDVPYLNETVMSRTRAQLLERTGSRYAPASPCERLGWIEDAPSPCVFIGKPCDVAGARRAAAVRPRLAENLGLTIGFFCAGTPSTRGTLEMLAAMGVEDPNRLIELRYRGRGWPGKATATLRSEAGVETRELTYEQSWGAVLQKHRQWRCHLCADHTGEFADVAVGDPWYRPVRPGEAGQSLILARTPRGLAAVRGAIEAGYLRADVVAADVLPRSQPNLLQTRGSVWARLWVCRWLGAAAPRFVRMPMFRHWLGALSLKQKAQSITGTIRRVFRRKLRRRVALQVSD